MSRKNPPKNKNFSDREHSSNFENLETEGSNLKPNPFTIVGDAKPSKTGLSLSMRIRCSDGEVHHYTIAKKDLENVFLTPPMEEIIPAAIREYHNP